MISIWQMIVVREVLKLGSVLAAARSLGRTQPALSATIKELEKQLNIKLFERDRGRLLPVPEAYFLSEKADEILAQVEALENQMRGDDAAIPAQIDVTSMPVLSEHFLPKVIANFTKRHSKAGFRMAVQGSSDILAGIEAQRFDVGIAERGQETPLVNCKSFEVGCVCALPAGDPLLAKSVIRPADLAGRDCTSFMPEHHITRALQVVFDDVGIALNSKFHMQNSAAQYEIIEATGAFGMFSPLNAWIYRRLYGDMPKIVFRQFAPRINFQFAILTPKRRQLSRAAKAFRDELEAAIHVMLDEAQEIITEN